MEVLGVTGGQQEIGMKYKTAELEGEELDEAVALALGWKQMGGYWWEPGTIEKDGGLVLPDGRGSGCRRRVEMYCRDWAHAAPIIERERIGILPATKEVAADRNYRRRTGRHFMTEQDGWVAGYEPITHIEFDWGGASEIGPTPLIAAMRVFVAT